MPEPVGEKYKPVAEVLKPESKMNFRLGEVIENNLVRAIAKGVDLSPEVVWEWVGEVKGCCQNLLTAMSQDSSGRRVEHTNEGKLIRGSEWVRKLGIMSGEEKALAVACFLARSLGVELEDESNKDLPLVKFIAESKRKATQKANYGIGTNWLFGLFRKDERGGIAVGTTKKRFQLVLELTRQLVEYHPVVEGQRRSFPYYTELSIHRGGEGVDRVRRTEEIGRERQEILEENERVRRETEELEGRVQGGLGRDSDEYRERSRALRRRFIPVGTSCRCDDTLVIPYCLEKYKIEDEAGLGVKKKSLGEKVMEVRDRLRGWFGIEKKEEEVKKNS